MHTKNRAIALQTALALLAGSLMIGEAARTLQFQPESSSQDAAETAGLNGDPGTQSVQFTSSQAQAPIDSASTSPQETEIPYTQSMPRHAAVYTGTILRSGSSYVLRDPSGSLYQLDAPLKARPYESRLVRVTGDLEVTGHLLHIEQIENLPA